MQTLWVACAIYAGTMLGVAVLIRLITISDYSTHPHHASWQMAVTLSVNAIAVAIIIAAYLSH